MYPIIMHVNYLEQGQSIAEICEIASSIGYDGIEFRRCRPAVKETTEQYLREIAKRAREFGLKHIYFGRPGVNINSCEKEKIQKGLDEYKLFLSVAAETTGIELINYLGDPLSVPALDWYVLDEHGSAFSTDEHFKWTAEVCSEIAEIIAPMGGKLAFETHPHFIHDTIEATQRLVDMVDKSNVGINLDYGNIVYFGKKAPSVEKAIDACGDKLFYIHMKNSIGFKERRIETALAEGEINHRAYVRYLKNKGYKGCIGIEAPRNGDRQYFAEADYNYLKGIILALEKEN